MYLQNELKNIAERLFEEKICMLPLDERSLREIHRFMGLSETGCDLMRRLSDIEINLEEITSEAEQAVSEIKETITSCQDLFKTLIDGWSKKGLTNDISFSVSKSELSAMYGDYSLMADALTTTTKELSNSCNLLAELALQTKACSASFLEVYNDTRLAYYAAALNKDTENMLSCRAISLQAHSSSTESNKDSAKYLSVSRSGTAALSVIGSVISETTEIFNHLSETKESNKSLPVRKLINGIQTLKNIASAIKIT